MKINHRKNNYITLKKHSDIYYEWKKTYDSNGSCVFFFTLNTSFLGAIPDLFGISQTIFILATILLSIIFSIFFINQKG